MVRDSGGSVKLQFLHDLTRVRKGILGIRDLTKKRCRIRENAKYLDGIRDLTTTREARFAKICARDAGFFYLSVGNSGNRHVMHFGAFPCSFLPSYKVK